MNTKYVGQYFRYSTSSDGGSIDEQAGRAIATLKDKELTAQPNDTAIYCRAGDNSGIKLQRQHQVCLDYADKTFPGIPTPLHYCDPGYDRDALKQLLRDVASGSIKVVIVEDMDRLARYAVKLFEICQHLERYNVRLHCAARGAVAIPLQSLGILAEETRRMQGERLKAGKVRASALRAAAVAAK